MRLRGPVAARPCAERTRASQPGGGKTEQRRRVRVDLPRPEVPGDVAVVVELERGLQPAEAVLDPGYSPRIQPVLSGAQLASGRAILCSQCCGLAVNNSWIWRVSTATCSVRSLSCAVSWVFSSRSFVSLSVSVLICAPRLYVDSSSWVWRLSAISAETLSRSACRVCASRINGAAYAACVENARFKRMNGYGSQCRTTAMELTMIHTTTTIDWPMMYCGVPKNRATFSETRPKVSSPKAP